MCSSDRTSGRPCDQAGIEDERAGSSDLLGEFATQGVHPVLAGFDAAGRQLLDARQERIIDGATENEHSTIRVDDRTDHKLGDAVAVGVETQPLKIDARWWPPA